MAKTRKVEPCERNSTTCCLLRNHDGSCIFYRAAKLASESGTSWRVLLSKEDGVVLTTFDVISEPSFDQVRAGTVFLFDPGRFPAALRKHLPELVETVYPDVSTDQTP